MFSQLLMVLFWVFFLWNKIYRSVHPFIWEGRMDYPLIKKLFFNIFMIFINYYKIDFQNKTELWKQEMEFSSTSRHFFFQKYFHLGPGFLKRKIKVSKQEIKSFCLLPGHRSKIWTYWSYSFLLTLPLFCRKWFKSGLLVFETPPFYGSKWGHPLKNSF